jgi:hypothetical protein
MKDPTHLKAEVKVADTVVTIRPTGQSQAMLAKILGRDLDAEGNERIWLDRLLHRHIHVTVGSDSSVWRVAGCFTTVLTGPFEAALKKV